MTMIQIRNVPPELHRRLKVRAAEAGMTLSDYLLRMADREAHLSTPDEIRQRLRQLPPVESDVSAAEIVRALREESG